MRVVLFVIVLAVTGCGAAAKPKPSQRAAIPDVRGMNLPDAAVKLIEARYCVLTEPGTPPANDDRPKPGKLTTGMEMPVEQQSPPAGSSGRRWSMVTLTVGGISKHAATYVNVWDGGAKIPCPPIGTTR